MLNLEFGDRTMVDDTHKVLSKGWFATADCFALHGVAIPPDLCLTKPFAGYSTSEAPACQACGLWQFEYQWKTE